ncbi:major facilitator superfamily domain-containing protein 6-like [Clytia hemisphaerica]|uniref:major facilitator superfamily domain-containing protein 6-like n=1 Tax=Clytia hemisphaerica TaxID=252671 RepID=UPI0034D44F06
MIIGGPFWGLIADKWHCHRIVILLMCITSLLTISTQPFVGLHFGNPETNKCPYVKDTTLSSMNVSYGAVNETGYVYNRTVATALPRSNEDNENIESNRFGTFYFVMVLINIGVSFAEGSALAFVDTGTLRRSQLAPKDRPLTYGRQRMFAALGAAFGIFATNLAVDFFPAANITCYAGIFVVYVFFTLCYGASSITLFRGVSFKSDHEEKNKEEDEQNEEEETTNKTKKNLRKTLIKTLFQYDVIFFYLTTFVSGLEYSQFTSFLYPYLREMDAPSILLTLSVVISNLASVVGFAFCQDIIHKLGGTYRSFAFVFLMYFVRYFGIGFIQNPWVVLIFQPLHAVSATLFIATGLTHLKATSPLPVITTLISLFNTTHYGLGTIIGSSISGIIYEKYGGRTLFKSTSMLALVWLLVLIVYIVLVVRKRERKEKGAAGKTNGLLLMEPVQDCNIKEEKA